jgi:hypothetical protein
VHGVALTWWRAVDSVAGVPVCLSVPLQREACTPLLQRKTKIAEAFERQRRGNGVTRVFEPLSRLLRGFNYLPNNP